MKFYSQVIDGKAWGHPCVVFLPADRKVYDAARRRGKIVIVGQRSWDGLATGPWRDSFLGNYGEPIAARTGYPTMICPVPGEYDGTGGQEISIGFLGAKSEGEPGSGRPQLFPAGRALPAGPRRHGRDPEDRSGADPGRSSAGTASGRLRPIRPRPSIPTGSSASSTWATNRRGRAWPSRRGAASARPSTGPSSRPRSSTSEARTRTATGCSTSTASRR